MDGQMWSWALFGGSITSIMLSQIGLEKISRALIVAVLALSVVGLAGFLG